jgi:hypothetical protein
MVTIHPNHSLWQLDTEMLRATYKSLNHSTDLDALATWDKPTLVQAVFEAQVGKQFNPVTQSWEAAPVTTEKAQAVLAAVVARYWQYFEPVTDSGGKIIAVPFEKPFIRRDERGHAIVVWDDGPDDWAHQATGGGSTETERVLVAAANQEFGGSKKAGEPEPVTFPADVNVEVYDSKSLGVYPA